MIVHGMLPAIWTWVFWLSAAFFVYTYAGYPLLLAAYRRFRPVTPAPDGEAIPFLSIILTVRNEGENVRAKLENLLAVDYPADRMEILVASDGSTDGTNAIVRGFQDPRVRLVELATPVGKAEAINQTAPRAAGEVLVLMDVRQRVDPKALRFLAARFADPEVAVVGGEMVIVDAEGRPTAEGTGIYWRFERRLRALESDLEMLTGVSGCFFALRKEVFRPIPPGSYCEDVTLVLYARAARWKVRWEQRARCYEQLRSPRVEFSRKVRTLVGNYQLLLQFWPLYLPWRGRLAFTLISHKLCRLFIPLALMLLLASAAALAPHSALYTGALAGQGAVYALGMVGIASVRSRRRFRLANACSTFCMLNGAAFLALIHVLRHGPRIGWR